MPGPGPNPIIESRAFKNQSFWRQAAASSWASLEGSIDFQLQVGVTCPEPPKSRACKIENLGWQKFSNVFTVDECFTGLSTSFSTVNHQENRLKSAYS